MLITIRRLLAVFLLPIFLVLFVATLTIFRVNATLLEADFYTGTLERLDVFTFLYDEALPFAIEDSGIDLAGLPLGIDLTADAIAGYAARVLPPDWLAENEVSMILSGTQTMPSGADAAYDEAYANPGKLHSAGVKIAFATFNSANSRTLPYEAAQAVPYGLPHDAALNAVIKNAAEMLGLDDRIGTIEEGKLANIIVTDGDPLEIQTQVTDLFIMGRAVSTDNRHKSLYEKYRSRPRGRIIS